MKIRSAVLPAMGVAAPYVESRPLAIEELELAPPGPGEVLIRIVAAGLCHSDLSVINGDRPRPVPMALGHEAAGVVEEIGPEVGPGSQLQPGDHVVLVFVPSCGTCEPCRIGRPALCEPGAAANTAGTLLSGARRLSRGDGTPIHHHLGVSAFSDAVVVSARSAVKVPSDLPLAEAALFGCAVLTGVGAVLNTAAMPTGSSAAVIGLGGVGLSALMGASAAGARSIVATDLSDRKLALARELGATHTVNAQQPDAREEIRDLTGGGVDFAFELAGSVPALELAWNVTRRGGTTVTAGLPNPAARLSVSPVTLVAEERTLKGSYIGTAVPGRDVPRYIDLYRGGRLPVDRLRSGAMVLDDINEGFDLLHSGQAVRQLIEWPD